MGELGHVPARRQADTDGVFCSGGSIVVIQALSQGVRCDTNNRIHLRIKIMRAAEGLDRNVVFLISAVAPSKCFFAHKGQGSRRRDLFARPSIPEFRMASSSARSKATNLLMDECKRPSPGKTARAFHDLPFFPGEYAAIFRKRAALRENLTTR